MHRAVSLVMIVALAGTPALAAACVALCMPGVAKSASIAVADGAAHHHLQPSMSQSPTQATTSETPASAADHHQSLANSEPFPDRTPEGAVEVAASDRSCCTNTDAALSAAVAAVRADSAALLATAAVVATPFHSQLSRTSEAGYSPPVARPAPTRCPLVLRV